MKDITPPIWKIKIRRQTGNEQKKQETTREAKNNQDKHKENEKNSTGVAAQWALKMKYIRKDLCVSLPYISLSHCNSRYSRVGMNVQMERRRERRLEPPRTCNKNDNRIKPFHQLWEGVTLLFFPLDASHQLLSGLACSTDCSNKHMDYWLCWWSQEVEMSLLTRHSFVKWKWTLIGFLVIITPKKANKLGNTRWYGLLFTMNDAKSNLHAPSFLKMRS